MNIPATSKAREKDNPKPNTTKPGADQEKVINQLKQEIRTLTKTVKDMQKKPNTQDVTVTIPRQLFTKINAFLLDYSKSTGETICLSDLICDAIDIYLWCEEENKRLEEERQTVESANGDEK